MKTSNCVPVHRDGNTISFWENTQSTFSTSQNAAREADVIIVGAGITGVTLAVELQKRGKKCTILEAHEPGFGTTGGTTAHINNFFDSSYDEVIKKFGENQAKVIAKYAQNAIEKIAENVRSYGIGCDFERCSFFLFSAEEKQNKLLENIYDAHKTVGIETEYTEQLPFPLDFNKCIEIKGQAHFHPLKYISGMLKHFTDSGGIVLNHTPVEKYEIAGGGVTVFTNSGEFQAKSIIWATHIPPGNNRFNLLAAPYRSYALTAKLNQAPEKPAQTADLYDPYHYVRYHKEGESHYLIAGGYDHKTGHEEEPEKCAAQLRKYVADNFGAPEIVNEWSSQYYVPADGMPYIGPMPGEENVYISIAYNGNGMTFGTMASLIIPDLLDGTENELGQILSPGRIKPVASVGSALPESADAIFTLVKDKFSAEKVDSFDDIESGSGKVVKVDGKTVAVFKDKSGAITKLSPVCPHMGCNVKWNSYENTWDCPCHGSRFACDGTLLGGPAAKDLSKI